MDMTPQQCRMARAALEWSQQQLADAAAVRQTTVSDYERGGDARRSTVQKLRAAMEQAGVVFVGAGEVSMSGGAGVRAGN
ncbi:helix-turn-helix transcriptional regulator [Sphingomonas sp. PAMC 26617]|uniref:helix-turn-helix transcriptional regulator n=1 Tax=Sphingomonas sp. PAMC 26617 TaxID=1112216 RepID=UPI0002885005|nr:helix-turn-helix transcriptional regulator [Sphingomonas sp. PAMC 26617]